MLPYSHFCIQSRLDSKEKNLNFFLKNQILIWRLIWVKSMSVSYQNLALFTRVWNITRNPTTGQEMEKTQPSTEGTWPAESESVRRLQRCPVQRFWPTLIWVWWWCFHSTCTKLVRIYFLKTLQKTFQFKLNFKSKFQFQFWISRHFPSKQKSK